MKIANICISVKANRIVSKPFIFQKDGKKKCKGGYA
jgi:hypothetical protein